MSLILRHLCYLNCKNRYFRCVLIATNPLFKSLNKHITIRMLFILSMFWVTTTSVSQTISNEKCLQLLDSAKVHTEKCSNKAQLYLDSIPEPVEDKLKGRLADYYAIKALLHDERSEYARVYQRYILAIKYAEKEKNYQVAGNACLELFALLHYAKKDNLASGYLDKAKHYYKVSNYKHGLLEVEQMHAYVAFSKRQYEACNKMLLNRLDVYKKVKDDTYFYLFATYMLTSNYINTGELNNAHKYLNVFKSLKDNTTIASYNYRAFNVGINLSFAKHYFKNKQLDSTAYYMDKASALKAYMSSELLRKYYNINVDVHKTQGNIDLSKKYLDSLALLENKISNTNMDATVQINNVLLNTESQLQQQASMKFWNGVLALLLFCILSFLMVFFLIYYKKNKNKLDHTKKEISNLSYLKSNNEKLSGKVLGLEEYIINLKKEVKEISKIRDEADSRQRVKELYKNLHHNSSTLIDKSENHLELVNELNVEFFNKIQTKYPQLNDSEVITCYYLFMGFKNKEIALFLNISIRALESKRYRISKKINLNTKEVSLLEHINTTFKQVQVK